ncbi:MAG: HAD family hydrolase, partial [Campylobacterota bacterium]
MQKIVIFDMDGTLIDSGNDITHSVNYVRQERYSLSPMSVQSVVDAINAPHRNLAEIFYGTSRYEPEAKELFESHYYDQCIKNVSAYNGIIEVLETLRGANARMGVATNAPGLFARRMLSHLGM